MNRWLDLVDSPEDLKRIPVDNLKELAEEIANNVSLIVMSLGAATPETYERIKVMNIECPVIISTGYIKEMELDQIMKDGIAGLIRKPFQMRELSRLVAQSFRNQTN